VSPDEGLLPLDLFAFGRGLAYGATLVLVGCCVFAALIPRWRAAGDDDRSLAARAVARLWPIAAAAAALLITAHLIRAYGEVRAFLDPDPITWADARPVLLASAWGRRWQLQLLAALASLPLALAVRRRPAAGLALLGTAALAVVITTPFTGHARENPWGTSLGLGLHSLHLLGGGIWLGTLFCLAVAGLRPALAGDAAAVARMVNAFSPVALVGAGLAISAGGLMAWAYVGSLANLWSTTYGKALLVKLLCLAGTAAIGALNWRVVRPRLGTPDATNRLRRSALFELAFALLLLGATAVLVALPAPTL
jgi:putative copper export protein